MNTYKTQIFCDLESLVASNEAFYRQQFISDGHIYWIYNYRLASYTDFMLPSALECRGIMFEVDETGKPIDLKSLPFYKFFNAFENPLSMDLDFSAVDSIYVKADGSLMSTYVENGSLKIKSKGSISSKQAISAMKILEKSPDFRHRLHQANDDGYTVNLEYMSQEHRIVLNYATPHLKVLNARSRDDGHFMSYDDLISRFGIENTIEKINVSDTFTFCNSIIDMTDIEGFVIWMKDGRIVKQKCQWYISLHHAKDSLTNPRRLFECVLDEGTDDLRSMFATDQVALNLIQDMENLTQKLYNHLVNSVETYYNENKHLDRKEYAIKGKQFLNSMEFGLAMNLYTGRVNDYKEFMKSRYKEFGIRDTICEKE